MRIEFTLPGRVGGVTAGMYQKHIHTKLKRWGAHHNIVVQTARTMRYFSVTLPTASDYTLFMLSWDKADDFSAPVLVP